MNAPIYSVEAECRDCYKCVRHCPVKAIKVVNDHAEVSPDACILCGHCVNVCRHNAKRVRDDLARVRELVSHLGTVHASLAPSYVSEFLGVRPAQLVTALKKLGFAGVHETAEGAQRVSEEVATFLESAKPGVYISTACPVAVELILRYYPHLTSCLTPILPPMLAHARIIKETVGSSASVVFIGPCIGKKRDADSRHDLLYAALTFEELRRWMDEAGIHPETLEDDPSWQAPCEGAFYPLEGGMNKTIRRHLVRRDLDDTLVTVSGIENLRRQLNGLDPTAFDKPVFLETLACDGGCIAGPKTQTAQVIAAHAAVLNHASSEKLQTVPAVDVNVAWQAQPATAPDYTDAEIVTALHRVGKFTKADRLNCGGCGYDNCRAFACALLRGVAEPQMCVSYMRTLAQKKSNALTRALPYGVVMVDADLKIMECNELFATMLGGSVKELYDIQPGLKDAELARVLPFAHLFEQALRGGHEALRKNVKCEDRIFSVTVFAITPRRVVGALMLDITDTEAKRQQLIEKSHEVIKNTTKTVHEIAFMLGKNTAQSELILNSLMDLYAAEDRTE